MMQRFSPEFDLVALCCRHDDPAVPARLDATDWETIDVSRVVRIARRHRVEALVAQSLSKTEAAGEIALSPLVERARATAIDSLRLARSACLLGAQLDAAGIDWISIKGPAIAQLAYRSTAIKASRDLDILVSPSQFAAVFTLLADHGYQRVEPGPEVSAAQLATWMHHYKDCAWHHPASGMLVEVHGRLFANRLLMPSIGLNSPRQQVALPGIGTLPTLATAPLYAYLAGHGAVSTWSRLKWLADIAALLRPLGPGALAELHADAALLGGGRCSAQALLLAERVLGLQLPDGMAAALRRAPAVHRLEQLALAAMKGRNETEEVDWSGFATFPGQAAHLLLGGSWRFVGAEIAQKFANPADRAREVLPTWASGMYPLLAASRYLGRRIMRRERA